MIQIAVIAGSFDPFTNGHMDLVRRASALFPHVTVLVCRNGEKSYLFDGETRLEMVKAAIAGMEHVTAELYDGLLAAYVAQHNGVLVKGVRNGSDTDYELQLSAINRSIHETVDTVLLPVQPEYAHISSSYIREMLHYGVDFSKDVPQAVMCLIEKK